jgi:hypothetical protein
MHRDSVRKISAFLLALFVWSSAVAFYPTSVAAQTTAQNKRDDKKQPKKEKVKKEEKKKIRR